MSGETQQGAKRWVTARRWSVLTRPAMVAGLAAVGPAVGGVAALAVAYRYSDTLRAGGTDFGLAATGLLLCGVLGCSVFLLPTYALAVVAGWSLGAVWGAAVATLAATFAAPLGYLLGGRLAGPGLDRWAGQYPQAEAVFESVRHAGAVPAAGLIALLRLSPVVPYGMINVLAAVAGVRRVPFLLGTLAGLAPRVTVMAYWSSKLEQLDAGELETRPGMLIAGAVATLAAVLLLGVWGRRVLTGVVEKTGQSERR